MLCGAFIRGGICVGVVRIGVDLEGVCVQVSVQIGVGVMSLRDTLKYLLMYVGRCRRPPYIILDSSCGV